jgi:hypothetical protein
VFDIDIEHFPGSSSGSGRCRRGSSYLAWDRRNGSPRALRDRRRVVEHPAARSQRRQNRAQIASLTLSLAGFKWLSMAINYRKTMMRF